VIVDHPNSAETHGFFILRLGVFVIPELEVIRHGTANIFKTNATQTRESLLAQGAKARPATTRRKGVVSELVDEQDDPRRVQEFYAGQILVGDAV
jgi:hypothetical protein